MKGTIRKQGEGTWQLRFYSDSRQKSVTFKGTKAQAQRHLNGLLAAVDGGNYLEPGKLTTGEYLHKWLATVQTTVRPNTYAGYEATAKNHIVPSLGHIPLSRLTPLHIQQMLTDKQKDGARLDGKSGKLSARTVRYVRTVLYMSLAQAVKWQLLSRNPAGATDAPREERKEVKPWTAAQAQSFLKRVAGDRLYSLYLMAMATGMRRGELLGLRWQDIDFETGAANVRQTVVAISGKTVFSTAKTVKGNRTIALSPALVSVLRQHRKRVLEEKLIHGLEYQDNGLVFPYPDGRPHCPNTLLRKFSRAIVGAGLPHTRIHDLRHLHATLLLAQGVHPKVVSERLGHASISITLDTYSHASLDMQKEAVLKLDEQLFGQLPEH